MISFSDVKLDLNQLHTVLNPINYFDTKQQRLSIRTYGQIFKDIHDILGHTLTNIELLQRTPYLLGGLLKRGTRLSVDSLKRALNGYIHRMSQCGEFNLVSEDLANLIFNLQRGQDNAKLISAGKSIIFDQFQFRWLKNIISEALTNLSYIAGTAQSSYKLIQEVSGFTGGRDRFGESMWERFQETTCFQKVIDDLEKAFTKVNDIMVHQDSNLFFSSVSQTTLVPLVSSSMDRYASNLVSTMFDGPLRIL